jgi:urease accessory protein
LFIVWFASITWASLTPLFAHSVDKRFGDFYGGMLHPLTSLAHLFPIIALGLLAGQQGAKRARWTLLVFPAGLLAGAIGSLFGEPFTWITWLNQFSFVALGLLVAAALRIPFSALLALSLLFGLTHGYENAVGVTSSATMHRFVPGVVASGLALLALVAAITVALERPWQQIAVRVAGSWIAAIGILMLGLP